MSLRWKALAAVAALALVLAATALLLWSVAPKYESFFPLVISVIALSVALISAFKNELFDFKLTARGGEIALAGSGNPSHKSFVIIQSLIFVNQGYGHGVVEAFVLKIHGADGVKLYTPIAEVDFEKFLQFMKPLGAEHMKGAVGPIVLGSKEAIKRFVAFSQEEKHSKYPFTEWKAGKHRFELWVTSSASTEPQLLHVHEWDIGQWAIDAYDKGETSVLTDHRIEV
jgi:hypothetical protein